MYNLNDIHCGDSNDGPYWCDEEQRLILYRVIEIRMKTCTCGLVQFLVVGLDSTAKRKTVNEGGGEKEDYVGIDREETM